MRLFRLVKDVEIREMSNVQVIYPKGWEFQGEVPEWSERYVNAQVRGGFGFYRPTFIEGEWEKITVITPPLYLQRNNEQSK